MVIVRERDLRRVWFGPIAYVFSACLSSAINLGTLNRLENTVSASVISDTKGILAGFTSIALIGFALQFAYARAIGRGHRGTWNLGFGTAAFIAGIVGVATSLSIQSSLDFRITTGFWIGSATFLALLPSATLASHLVNEKWRSICLFVISSSVFRFFLWELPIVKNGLSSILATLTASYLFSFVLLLLVSEVRNYDEHQQIQLHNQRKPVGTLTGLTLLIVLGSLGRKSALGASSAEFAEISLVGRNLFFIAAILAYAAFPFLTTHELFSQDLGKRFRQSEVLVIVSTVGLGIAVLTNNFIAQEVFGLDRNVNRDLLVVVILSWSFLSISLIPILYYVAHESQLGLTTLALALGMLIAQFITTTSLSLALAFLFLTSLLASIALVPVILRSRPIVRADVVRNERIDPVEQEEVTIVVPSHNPGPAGLATVLSIRKHFVNHGIDVRIIAVSDGSTDESVDLYNSLSSNWFQHLNLPENRGKGAALKEGFAQSTSQITGFIDADGDIPPHILVRMYRELIQRDADVVFGSKWHPDSKVQVSVSRRLLSRSHHLIQRLLFKIDIDDTQVGIKLYRSSSLQNVLPTLREDRFSLDIEIFVALAAYGHNTFVEMPVEIDRKGGSTVSFRNVLISFFELLRIFWRARVSLNYEGRAYVSKTEIEVRQV